jgi:hypothetical protein
VQATMNRNKCFLAKLQFNGSFGSLVGCRSISPSSPFSEDSFEGSFSRSWKLDVGFSSLMIIELALMSSQVGDDAVVAILV